MIKLGLTEIIEKKIINIGKEEFKKLSKEEQIDLMCKLRNEYRLRRKELSSGVRTLRAKDLKLGVKTNILCNIIENKNTDKFIHTFF